MTEENKRRNIASETARGDRALEEARVLHAARLFEGAVSRAYMAAFHYARALLMSESIQARSHAGVRSQLSMHFVLTGRIRPEDAGSLAQLQGLREQSDYDSAVVFTDAMADEALARAAAFVDASRRLLVEMRYL